MTEYSRIIRLNPFDEKVYDPEGNECTLVKDIFTYDEFLRYKHIRYEVPTTEELEAFNKRLTKDIILDLALGVSALIGAVLLIIL